MTSQHSPVGPIPSNARLLISGLQWCDTRTVLNTAQLVHIDDLDEPHRTIYAATIACARDGLTGPRAILDRLMRDGDTSKQVHDELVQSINAGGIAEHWQAYAAQVLSVRFRAACESYGQGVIGWADTGSESELWHGITSNGTELRKLADRLTKARGGEL